MFLLVRSISPYTDCDQLLGVFVSQLAGEEARQVYINRIESGELGDPFAKQAYHNVSLADDVKLVSDIGVIDVTPQASEVHVVSSFAEAFGQVIRKFEAICGTKERAAQVAAQIEATDEDSYTVVDPISVNQLILLAQHA